MRRAYHLIAAGAISLASAGPVPAEEAGYTPLLNAEHAAEWKHIGEGEMRVEGGVATTYTPKEAASGGIFYYQKKRFSDFSLKLEFRVDSETSNSGVMVRLGDPAAGYEAALSAGYEVDIYGPKTGTILATPDRVRPTHPVNIVPGAWNELEVLAVEQHYVVRLNGQTVNDYTGARSRIGYVALQNHSGAGETRFRNVRIKEGASVNPSGGTAQSLTPAVGTDGTAGGSFVHDHSGAMVVVKDEAGAGSGFIASFSGKIYLLTNIHVAAGMKQPVFTLLDGTRLVPTSAEAAVGHDIMRFALKTPPAQSIEVGTDLEHTTRIGDPVNVFGNSGGGGVVTSLPGKIVGIGPDRLEVTSPFIPGNSGSPIIHGPTGRVIGIATYLMSARDRFGGGGVTVRRFGYRLDSVKTWEPVNWLGFHAEEEEVEKVSALTADILNFVQALQQKQTPALQTEALRRAATEWRQKSSNPRISQVDRHAATQSFIASLRSLSRSDVAALDGRLHYSYFRAKLAEERQIRDQLYKSFDELSQTLAMPSTRGF